MELTPANNPATVVLDACLVVGVCAKEADKHAQAEAALAAYAVAGARLFAPGVVIAEVLHALCRKLRDKEFTQHQYNNALSNFMDLMDAVNHPPKGDTSLILRAEQIRGSYGCKRVVDAIYIALAEELTEFGATRLATFDKGMSNQAAKNAPGVDVDVIGSDIP